nr:hypothetical protein asmbl_3 [uncultured bacterium]
MLAADMVELGVVDPVSAGLVQQGVVRVQVQGSTGLAGGASLAQRATSAGGSEGDVSAWGDRRLAPVGAGHGVGLVVDGEVVEGESVGDCGSQRAGFDDRGVSLAGECGSGVAGAIGAVAQHLALAVFVIEQCQPDHGLVVVLAGCLGEPAAGEQSGVGLDGHVSFVAVLAMVHGFVHVSGLGVHCRDHPVAGHLARDAPPPVGAIGSFGGLDVLPGDQRQQRQRLPSPVVERRLAQRVHDHGGIAHNADTGASRAWSSSQAMAGLPASW